MQINFKYAIGPFILFLLYHNTWAEIEKTNELKPFFTDYCTLFLDGPPEMPGAWKNCCLVHDMRYWYGGNFSDRDNADLDLKSCVNDISGEKWSNIVYSGVRLGHMSPIKNKTEWSWGWKNKRENITLSTSEKEYAKNEIKRLPFDQNIIDEFIKKYF